MVSALVTLLNTIIISKINLPVLINTTKLLIIIPMVNMVYLLSMVVGGVIGWDHNYRSSKYQLRAARLCYNYDDLSLN